MAIWPFNRNQKQSTDVPKEVQDYYQAEKREKVGVAGLLALGTLLVTVILAMGLFFGGRWVYQTVFKDDQPQQTAQTQEDDDRPPATADEEEEKDESDDESHQPEPAPSNNPATPPATGGTNTQTESNSKSTDLPATGPEDVIIVALSAAFFGSAWYYIFGGKKQTD